MMRVKIRIVAIVLAAMSISVASAIMVQAQAPDRLGDLRSRFAHEPNAIARAKLMPQLGDAEFAEIDSDVMQDKLPEALAILESYRDEAESCDKALGATGTDAEKHPGGFKQLEFSLRDSLRRLDAVIVNMTSDEQAPFLDIRKQLSDLNMRLIDNLFPHAPPAKPKP